MAFLFLSMRYKESFLATKLLTASFPIRTKIYQTVDGLRPKFRLKFIRPSSTKQNIPVHRRADSDYVTSRSLTCMVTTRWRRSFDFEPGCGDTARRILEDPRVRQTSRRRRRASSDRQVAIFVFSNIPNHQLTFLPLTLPPVEDV